MPQVLFLRNPGRDLRAACKLTTDLRLERVVRDVSQEAAELLLAAGVAELVTERKQSKHNKE